MPEEQAQDEQTSLRELITAEYDKDEEVTEESPIEEEVVEVASDTDFEGEQGLAEESDESQDETEDVQEEPIENPVLPPISWTADRKEEFASLPRELQEYVVQREKERETFLQKKSQELSEVNNAYQNINKVLDPVKQHLSLQGLTEEQYLSQLVAADNLLRTNPQQAAQWLNQQYNLGLGVQTTDQQSDQTSHVDIATQQRLQALESQLQQQQQSRQLQAQQTQEQMAVEANSAVESFAVEVDEKGQLKYPYFADVYNDMVGVVNLLRQQNPNASHRELLGQAYEKATRLNDDVYSKLQAKQSTASEKARIEEKKKRAAAAKKAGSSVSGAPSGNVPAAPDPSKLSIRDSLKSAFNNY